MLKSYDELREIDVTPYTEERDNARYLNWAKCIDLLHKNGAEEVYFVPCTNQNGSSLFMSENTFETGSGTNKKTNRCYETRIEIHIDGKVYMMQSPVMNGANPVQDNSMTQQRVWNSMCRSFVKGVAIYTGLGFDLWLKNEENDNKNNIDDDLSKHDIFKIKERCQQIYTQKLKEGLSVKEIAEKLHKTEDEVKALFSYFDTLSNFERDLSNIDTKSR